MKVVAITACIAGIAQTYMGAAAIKQAAKTKGIEIYVETQGALGIQDRLKQKDIDEADFVIFAVDTKVSQAERFNNKKILTVKVSEVVRDAGKVFEKGMKL
jgi:PTS system fructose-specific IIB component/fructose-specific PTS system IIB-like component